jgi:hypothetical protein
MTAICPNHPAHGQINALDSQMLHIWPIILRFGKEKQSELPSSEDDELTSDWNFSVVIFGIATNTMVKMNWIDYIPQLTKWICFLMAQDITELHR